MTSTVALFAPPGPVTVRVTVYEPEDAYTCVGLTSVDGGDWSPKSQASASIVPVDPEPSKEIEKSPVVQAGVPITATGGAGSGDGEGGSGDGEGGSGDGEGNGVGCGVEPGVARGVGRGVSRGVLTGDGVSVEVLSLSLEPGDADASVDGSLALGSLV